MHTTNFLVVRLKYYIEDILYDYNIFYCMSNYTCIKNSSLELFHLFLILLARNTIVHMSKLRRSFGSNSKGEVVYDNDPLYFPYNRSDNFHVRNLLLSMIFKECNEDTRTS
jgi:hypothetical protein